METVHASPGRVRLRLRGLRYNDVAAAALQSAITRNSDVISARASSVTGTLLIEYRLETMLAKVRSVLVEVLANGLHQPASRAPELPEKNNRNTAHVFDWLRHLFSRVQPKAVQASVSADILSSAERWHAISCEETMRQLAVTPSGLSIREAEERLKVTGPNRLPRPRPRSNLALLWDQLRSVPVALLLASAAVSFLTGGILDGVLIVSVIFTNAVIVPVGEERSARAPERCQVHGASSKS